ncbi:hypothetical protein PhaeoP23_02574 [Phaeobacter piscinae]|uniref:Uncharacterized protein n=1 Tax=Phaeobacter piscinae TaxID=1580596 RepID=A0ABN5DMR1_9RHOB|nr:hypothetical protein [Phaeobacter piscinae]ATG36684.1 hypothetical protein PhaeoP36_02574 [Phaeobacter piscinae]AUQ87205.1 hypothetical protein PhaeoP42_02575 [Phaeobacter piscinae]AUR25088.1 hypothetical protein PhaeoP23_02574 [Phaeobacter piscinae]
MLEVIESIDPTVLVALIGVLSVVVSAGTGALVSRWHTASKFRDELHKLRLERLNEQNDSYLGNAREQIGTVYVPLSAELAALKALYQSYLYQGKPDAGRSDFEAQIEKFVTRLQELELRGATAYVTTELEELLIKFVAFLRASQSASEIFVDVTYNFSVRFLGFDFRHGDSKKVNVSNATSKGFSASLSAAGIGADVRVSDIISAPIDTEDFQARFERDSYRLSLLIKEVTLGSAARKP